jgi:GH24 family phage-related lysozyme (muramidase)
MAGTGLPIPQTGGVLTEPPQPINAAALSTAQEWSKIAAAGDKIASAGFETLDQAQFKAQTSRQADQTTTIGRKQIDLAEQYRNDPAGFDAAWQDYSAKTLAGAAPQDVTHLKTVLGHAGNTAYHTTLERDIHLQQSSRQADQTTEIGRQQIDLSEKYRNDPEGFNAAWKDYSDATLAKAQPADVAHLKTVLGHAGVSAYRTGVERDIHLRQAGALAQFENAHLDWYVKAADDFRGDPEKFENAARAHNAGALSEVPAWLAPHAEKFLGGHLEAGLRTALHQKAAQDDQISSGALDTRIKSSDDDVMGVVMAGQYGTPRYDAAVAAYNAQLDTAVQTRVMSPDEAAFRRDDLSGRARGQVAGQSATRVYAEQGYAAAIDHLQRDVLQNEDLKLSPGQRWKAFNEGKRQVDLMRQADMQDRGAVVESSRDLRARIDSNQPYDAGEVKDTLGQLSRTGAAGEFHRLSVAAAVQEATAPYRSGLNLRQFATAVNAQRMAAVPTNVAEAIKQFEGFTPVAKQDFKQYSNGYGTQAASPTETIDQPTAEKRLNEAVAKAQAVVDRVNPNLPPGARAALTSLTYNTGADWVDSGLGEAVKAGDLAGARARFLQYNKAGGEVQPGLVARRQTEAGWFEVGAAGQPIGVPYSGEIAKRVQSTFVEQARKAWPQFETLINSGKQLDPEDFQSIRYAAALSGDALWQKKVEDLAVANQIGTAMRGQTEAGRQGTLDQVHADLQASGLPVISQETIAKSLDAQFQRQNKQVREDPIGYAIDNGSKPPIPLDIANSQNFQFGLAQRAAMVRGVAVAQGIPVGSALRPAEIATLHAVLDTAPPAGKAKIFADLATLPENIRNATFAKLHEKGGPAQVEAYAGALYPQAPDIAESIIRGQQAMKADERNNPLREGEKKQEFNDALDRVLPEAAFTLEGRTRALGAYTTLRGAAVARYADLMAQDPTLKKEFSETRLQQAVTDVSGGILTHNGAPFIAPARNMTQRQADGVLWGITDQDLAGVTDLKGNPVTPGYLRDRARLESLDDGRYLVRLGKNYAQPIYAYRNANTEIPDKFILDLRGRKQAPVPLEIDQGTMNPAL